MVETLPISPVEKRVARSTPAIRCVDVWKEYYFHAHRPRRLKDEIARLLSFKKRAPRKQVWSLREFNLEVHPGEVLGVVGHNGAGKSTLLKLLCRINSPTRGSVQINGRLSAIIELGAGFHEDLTGRENIYLAAGFMGLPRRKVDALYEQIVDFAELREHMETPVKYFSSGMHARLGFATAITVEPDVLLVDEVLAVGDAAFQPKCKAAIRRLHESGKTIVLVSHDLDAVRSICTRAIWLRDGQIGAQGDPVETINTYLEHYWPGCTKKP